MTYTHAVIDLETLSTRPEAVVLAIGAVKFDPSGSDFYNTLPEPGDGRRAFYRAVEIDSQRTLNRHVCPETAAWWTQQSIKAIQLTDGSEDTAQALRDFAAWMEGVEFLWGNGAAFDNAILRSLCADYEVPYPISRRGDMDLRTLRLLAGKPEKPPFIGIKHYALHDAFNEALIIQDCMRRISSNGQGSLLRQLGQ